MGKRRYRRKKASLEARLQEHQEKIAENGGNQCPIWGWFVIGNERSKHFKQGSKALKSV